MPLSQGEKAFYNTIKGALTMGGGVVGGGLGAPIGLGPGSPLTALGGAALGSGLGNAAGTSIENFAKAMQDEPTDPMDVAKAIPEGAAGEVGGQVAGKLAGNLISKLIPKVKLNAAGSPAVEYHGSTVEVPNPVISKTQTGIHGEVFHSTPDKPVADFFAEVRKLRDPSMLGKNGVVNAYVSKPGAELNLKASNIPEVGKALGLNNEQVAEITGDYAANGDLHDAFNKMFFKSMMNREINFSAMKDVGDEFAQTLKDQGIRRFSKPIFGFDKGRETINFYPEQDLIFKPEYDKKIDLINSGKNAASALLKALSINQATKGE